jgi:hypothetical protein
MIIDLCAHLGPWYHRPIGTSAAALQALLAPFGVSKVYAGRLEALWFENPHDANRLGSSEPAPEGIVEVPVLDPTLATWRDELDRLTKAGPLPMVRLYPNYGGYTLETASPLLEQLAKRKVVVQVITRMEDPRRQHPLAQVADVPVNDVLDAAGRHPSLRLLLSGASSAALQGLATRLPQGGNLWADTSQADGTGVVAGLLTTAWRERLVFGSHAPLFIPYSALARVVLDVDDTSAEQVFRKNAESLLG